jgi:DNA-binding FrmR family transcriptional regulator
MDKIVSSLNRIEGQVRGIRKMYEERRDCEAIAQQIAAAQSALKRVGKEMLTDEAVKCGKTSSSRRQMEKVINSVAKIS